MANTSNSVPHHDISGRGNAGGMSDFFTKKIYKCEGDVWFAVRKSDTFEISWLDIKCIMSSSLWVLLAIHEYLITKSNIVMFKPVLFWQKLFCFEIRIALRQSTKIPRRYVAFLQIWIMRQLPCSTCNSFGPLPTHPPSQQDFVKFGNYASDQCVRRSGDLCFRATCVCYSER